MIKNFTPHEIVLFAPEGEEVLATWESNGVARISVREIPCDPIDSFPCSTSEYGEVEGLPEPEPGTFLIVSTLVRDRCPNRADLISPDTFRGAVRDSEGRIIGTRKFQR